MADGPINFITNPDGTINIKNISKFGRSFSILRVPYSLKLLIQELQVMNVQMRIITDENVDQLLSMSYSDNISQLLKNKEPLNISISTYQQNVNAIINKPKTQKIVVPSETPELPEVSQSQSPEYAPYSPAYVPSENNDTNYDKNSSDYVPESSEEQMYEPMSPTSPPPRQMYEPTSPTSPPPPNVYYATASPTNSPQTELYYATASNPPSFSQDVFIPKTNAPSNILEVDEGSSSNLETSDTSNEKKEENNNKKVTINEKGDTNTETQKSDIKNITL